MSIEQLGLLVITGLFSVIAWLLQSKDAAQAASIKLLFEKHDLDAAALQDLRVQIAARHYERPELDAKFEKLDNTVRDGFKDLSARVDRLTELMTKGHTSQ